MRLIEPYLAPDGVIVSLQNGINEDRIAAIVGPERTLGCVVHYSGAMTEPAHAVRFSPTAWHSYSVGELDGRESERAARVAAMLSGAGPSATTTDIYGVLWAKLAINCMVNGLTASTGLSTPALWGSPLGLTLMLRLAAESARVAHAQGRRMRPLRLVATGGEVPPELLLDPAAEGRVRELMEAEGTARAAGPRSEEVATSMLQDIRKRRRPEIDYLNGYVVAEGARLGVETPANAAVVELLKGVASGDLPQEVSASRACRRRSLGLSAVSRRSRGFESLSLTPCGHFPRWFTHRAWTILASSSEPPGAPSKPTCSSAADALSMCSRTSASTRRWRCAATASSALGTRPHARCSTSPAVSSVRG